MTETEVKEMIKLKSEISKQIMRDIHFLVEKLNEAGELSFVGYESGWNYDFKKVDYKKPQELT